MHSCKGSRKVLRKSLQPGQKSLQTEPNFGRKIFRKATLKIRRRSVRLARRPENLIFFGKTMVYKRLPGHYRCVYWSAWNGKQIKTRACIAHWSGRLCEKRTHVLASYWSPLRIVPLLEARMLKRNEKLCEKRPFLLSKSCPFTLKTV